MLCGDGANGAFLLFILMHPSLGSISSPQASELGGEVILGEIWPYIFVLMRSRNQIKWENTRPYNYMARFKVI